MIRTGEARARVAGIFEVRDQPAVRRLLDRGPGSGRRGIADRARDSGGRKIARVRGQPAGGGSAAARNWRRSWAISTDNTISSLLFSSEAQREMLDAFAGNRELLDAAARCTRNGGRRPRSWRNWSVTNRRSCGCWTCGASSARKSRARRCEAGRRRALENERRVLQNVQKLQESAGTAYDAVYESPESAVALARIAAKRVEELCRIDASLDGLREHLKAAELSLQEGRTGCAIICPGWRRIRARLEEVENRLEAIARLKRKYGQSIAEILTFLEEVRRADRGGGSAGERMEELRKEQQAAGGGVRKGGAAH